MNILDAGFGLMTSIIYNFESNWSREWAAGYVAKNSSDVLDLSECFFGLTLATS